MRTKSSIEDLYGSTVDVVQGGVGQQLGQGLRHKAVNESPCLLHHPGDLGQLSGLGLQPTERVMFVGSNFFGEVGFLAPQEAMKMFDNRLSILTVDPFQSLCQHLV